MADSAKKTVMDEVRENLREFSEGMLEVKKAHLELRESQKETDRQMKETDRQMKETDRRLDKLNKSLDKTNNRFNDRWGDFAHDLIQGDLIGLLRNYGIEVVRIQPRFTYPPIDGRRGESLTWWPLTVKRSLLWK